MLESTPKSLLMDDYEPFKTKALVFKEQAARFKKGNDINNYEQKVLQQLQEVLKIIKFNYFEDQPICTWDCYDLYIDSLFQWIQSC